MELSDSILTVPPSLLINDSLQWGLDSWDLTTIHRVGELLSKIEKHPSSQSLAIHDLGLDVCFHYLDELIDSGAIWI